MVICLTEAQGMLFLCCVCYVNDQFEHQQGVFLWFIDYQKAFDKVRHSHLLTILKWIDIDDKDFRIICNLYYEQKAAIKLMEGLTEWTDIKQGVRQGCVMSVDLFNLYSEFILKELEEGIQVNGWCINKMLTTQ